MTGGQTPGHGGTGSELVEWRAGVRARLHAGAANGAAQLCVIEFWCEPGCGAPNHHHFEVEEVIAVVEGSADFEVDGERRRVEAGETIRLPAGSRHGFRNAGEAILRIFVIFPVAAPPVEYDEELGVTYEIAGTGDRRRDAHRAVT